LKADNKTVTVELQGGLGNQLFGWATGFALALRMRADLTLDTTKLQYRPYELDNFLLSEHVSTKNTQKRFRQRLFEREFSFTEASFEYDHRIKEIENSTTLHGYFQSSRYFEDAAGSIRSLVLLKNMSSEYLDFEKIVSAEQTLAVHVRRGDYVGLENYHGLTSEEYFRNAIRIANASMHFRKIMVFSDDIEVAKKVIPDADYFVSSDKLPSAAENLILMSNCSGLIGSNSSFSWWAGYLGDTPSSVRIFPRPWFADRNLDTRDLLLSHWITLGI
jgi:hypothetical protein